MSYFEPNKIGMDQAVYIHIKRKFIRIAFNDLFYVESEGHHLRMHTAHGVYVPHLSLKQLEGLLLAHQFVRVNRGALINLSMLKEFDADHATIRVATKGRPGDGKGLEDISLPFSKKYYDQLKSSISLAIHAGKIESDKDSFI